MKHLFTAVLCWISCLSVLGQSQYPSFVPPSPEASLFMKAGVGKVNFSTGAVSASIPFFDIKVGALSFPLGISYSSQGTKTDEPSSRAGFGWSLNVTGMVTRIVRGAPDELSTVLAEPANLGSDTYDNYQYAKTITNQAMGFDSQPDEYLFNFNGHSGKFVFNSAGQAVLTSHSNLKIQGSAALGYILITTTDGTKYRFGDNEFEQTTNHNNGAYGHYRTVTKTGYFLTKIEAPTGEWIEFNYSYLFTKTSTGATQTLMSAYGGSESLCHVCPTGLQDIVSFTTTTSKVDYDTRILSSITTSNGLTASFSYEDRPDQSLEKRLKYFMVSSAGVDLKSFTLHYFDPPGMDGYQLTPDGTNSIIGRFFLTKVSYSEPQEDEELPLITHDYTMEYEDMVNVAKPITVKQDFFGFANYNNSQYLLHPDPIYSFPQLSADRSPNFSAALIGTLKSITYPTGGKEEFFYEPNTISKVVERNTMVQETVEGAGETPANNAWNNITYYSDLIYSPRDQQVTFTATVSPGPGYSSGSPFTSFERNLDVKIYKDGNLIRQNFVNGTQSWVFDISMVAGSYYKVEMEVRDSYRTYGTVSYTYNESPANIYDTINEVVSGVRVKQIRLENFIPGQATSKYYTYGKFSDPSKSTGLLGGVPNSVRSFSYEFKPCDQVMGGYTACKYMTFSSNTNHTLFPFSGSHIYYTHILEHNSPDMVNGATEYEFHLPEIASNSLPIRGEADHLPADNFGTLTGVLKATRMYNASAVLVRESIDEYENIATSINLVPSLYVGKKHDVYESADAYADEMASFDIVRYFYQDKWMRLKKNIQREYNASRVLVNETTYAYGGENNLLPVSTASLNSKGQTKRVDKKYPTDFPADPVFAAMVTKNMISPAVEESSYLNNNFLQKTTTSYKDWFADGKVFRPDTVRSQKSPTDALTVDLVYDLYDSQGNPLQFHGKDNFSVSYLWDYHKTYPIAEVKNAAYGQVAFTSFEHETYGGWLPDAVEATINASIGFTGNRSFSGKLTRTVAITGSYVVSLWTKGSATVNGAAGTLVTTRRGWDLYRWSLTNPSTVTVLGTLIDELKLYPTAAQMSTNTFLPFVGVTGKVDPRENAAFFEYDQLQRLSIVRDIDSNIVKLYKYKYLEKASGCTNTTANWVPIGQPYCAKGGFSGNYTGYQLRDEQDLNPCSPTYLNFRQFNMGVAAACTPIPCSGDDKKVVNGVCETGVKVYTKSYLYSDNGFEIVFKCVYHYQWTDGSKSASYVEWSNTTCFPPE